MMKKVAQILDTALQPYLSDWTDAFASGNGELYVRSFISPKERETTAHNYPVLGENLSRTIKSTRLLSMIRNPTLALRWLNRESDVSARHRLSSWAGYAPLITYQPDVVHIINSHLYEKFAPVLSQINPKIIVSFRGFDTYIRPLVDRAWRSTLTKIYHRATCLHFVSHNLMQAAIKLGAPESKCTMIYPGIRLEYYKKTPLSEEGGDSEPTRLVSVGRLIWEKGYLIAIEAIKKLCEAGYNVEYQIIGEGPQRTEISYYIHRQDLQSRITLLGALSSEQIRQVLDRSDIYVQPSLSEALGVAVLEASAMELPVICTSAGGLPEIVDCDQTGIIVPPSNPSELARAIVMLVENPQLRKRLGKAGRERVNRCFALDSEVRKWQHVYFEVTQ